MKSERVIISIGKVHGRTPGMVDVSSCEIDEHGNRDAFQDDRIALNWDCLTDDGYDDGAILELVKKEIGATGMQI